MSEHNLSDLDVELEQLKVKALTNQVLDIHQTPQLIFKAIAWSNHLACKSPASEMFYKKRIIEILENIYAFYHQNLSLISFSGILLKGFYDPSGRTNRIGIMTEEFLNHFSDDQLITLKEAVIDSTWNLGPEDEAGVMRVFNKNRVLIDDILMNRPDPGTKLNGLID
ncbi:MAG: hypothetical protein KF802_02280 [Bdellovibrionaceae bacterium]|nr:hypothetical protein [Pseudobdellovibrionaceae bacterium]